MPMHTISKSVLRRHVSVVALACAAALGSMSVVQAQETKAEVIHWWTSGGESAAVKVFADQFAKAGGTWVDTAIAGGAAARTAAIQRVMGGKPPTAMQFNTGKQFDELVAGGLVADVDAVAKAEGWAKFMPAAFVASVSRDGKFMAIPVNIHGQNWLWSNPETLAKIGVQEPKDMDELFAALDKAKAAGLVPLAFSGAKNWERNLFNTVLLAVGGKEVYSNTYAKRDDAVLKSAGFLDAAKAFGKLRGYVDQGAPGRNWNDATAMVMNGKAAFQFMGDWAKGEFAAAGKVALKDYGCAVLGKDQAITMGGDVFVMAKTTDATQIKAQAILAKIMLDKDTQILFAQKKGSVPIRMDVDASQLDGCAQKAMKLLADPARQAPSTEMLASPAVTGAIEDPISEYWNTPSITPEMFVEKVTKALKAAQ
jgi:glucose/mannose transport system substrate-binding protein